MNENHQTLTNNDLTIPLWLKFATTIALASSILLTLFFLQTARVDLLGLSKQTWILISTTTLLISALFQIIFCFFPLSNPASLLYWFLRFSRDPFCILSLIALLYQIFNNPSQFSSREIALSLLSGGFFLFMFWIKPGAGPFSPPIRHRLPEFLSRKNIAGVLDRPAAKSFYFTLASVLFFFYIFSSLNGQFVWLTTSQTLLQNQIKTDNNHHYGYVVDIGADTFSQPAYNISPALLYENGQLIGPGNSSPEEISSLGLGRFIFWKSDLVFSSSDNSDPRNNGKTYQLALPLHFNPWFLRLFWLALLFTGLHYVQAPSLTPGIISASVKINLRSLQTWLLLFSGMIFLLLVDWNVLINRFPINFDDILFLICLGTGLKAAAGFFLPSRNFQASVFACAVLPFVLVLFQITPGIFWETLPLEKARFSPCPGQTPQVFCQRIALDLSGLPVSYFQMARVKENNKYLDSPGHLETETAMAGPGKFMLSNQQVIITASGLSNPKQNDRLYELILPIPLPAELLWVLGFFAAWALYLIRPALKVNLLLFLSLLVIYILTFRSLAPLLWWPFLAINSLILIFMFKYLGDRTFSCRQMLGFLALSCLVLLGVLEAG